MRYAEAIQFLSGLQRFGARPGLDTTRQLAALAGNPQAALRFIHVAGTNGKGSTCAMLESIYRAAGLRVGLFTSPHLVAFGERIQVNRRLISEDDLARRVAELQPLLADFSDETHPTFFEVVTVMALRYFAGKKCDLVIWETGLGGRLDATNIVTPLASVITNVQFDHQEWLGDTLAKIAVEKAGIIKPGVPVVTATDEPEALSVVTETANRLHAPLTVVNRLDSERAATNAETVSLLGDHQRLNASLARAVVRVLQKQIPVSDEAIRTGLGQVEWAGRLQVLPRANQTILLDGAHNAAGAAALRVALQKFFSNRPLALILGVLSDKDWLAVCETLAPLAGHIVLTPVASERTASPMTLAEGCRRANPTAVVAECGSLKEALAATERDPFVLITGSLYLVGEALELLNVSTAPGARESSLNEWRMSERPSPPAS